MELIHSFLNYLEFEKRYSKRTINSYQTDLFQFSQFCSSRGIEQLSEVDSKIVRNWVVVLLEDSCSNRSVNRKLSTLKSFYKFLLKQSFTEVNPLNKIDSLKIRKKLPVFVTSNQINQLLDEVTFNSDFSGIRNKLIIQVLYNTGIRLSELIALKEADVDKDNLTIKVLGKRNKERIIPITLPLFNAIEHYRIFKHQEFGNGCAFLFVSDSGTALYPKLVYRITTSALNHVTTMDKRSPHVLRHTFATHLLNNGAQISAIKEILGHTSLAATQVYTHNSFEKLKRIYKQAHPRA
ncbi:MAG: tyrosine-type recombinase/integrase [Bacteroidota bacterium]|nr:tyrosine-type recombinase/integrase [Bacteroidota bacterium]